MLSKKYISTRVFKHYARDAHHTTHTHTEREGERETETDTEREKCLELAFQGRVGFCLRYQQIVLWACTVFATVFTTTVKRAKHLKQE